MLEGELGSRSELEEVLETRGSEEAMASAAHGILETPHLHNGYLEALRTQWLIVEGVAVAGSAMVQICIDEESLAISTTYDYAFGAPCHEHGGSFRWQVEMPGRKEGRETVGRIPWFRNLGRIVCLFRPS